MTTLPPELMTPEQRKARAEEIPNEISREWLKFAITEAVLVLLPFTVVIIALVSTGSISESAQIPVVLAGGLACGALVTYWLLARIKPLQDERAKLERFDGA